MEPVALGALLVSVATLVLTGYAMSKSAQKGFVETLNQRVERLENEVADCERHRKQLLEENLTLIRRLANVANGGMS